MFLNILNQKEGKQFLELAHIAMSIDGKVEESEQAIFYAHKLELELQDYDLKNETYEALITAFQASTKRVKKAVLIEIAGVLDSDDVIDVKEESWIMKLGADLGFREAETKKMIRWTQDFNDLLQEAYDYINKR